MGVFEVAVLVRGTVNGYVRGQTCCDQWKASACAVTGRRRRGVAKLQVVLRYEFAVHEIVGSNGQSSDGRAAKTNIEVEPRCKHPWITV